MAQNNARIPVRTRLPGPQRTKDENATSRHVRQNSGSAIARAAAVAKAGASRQALGEVTIPTVNRKKTDGASKDKDGADTGIKRPRMSVTSGPQRIPMGPGRSTVAPPAASTINARAPRPTIRRAPTSTITVAIDEDSESEQEDVAEPEPESEHEMNMEDASLLINEAEVEAMTCADSDTAVDEEETARVAAAPRKARQWPEVETERAVRYRRELDAVRSDFHDDADVLDPTMVSEYAEEIFEYMEKLEDDMMPTGDYMKGQNEITWEMRQTLVDWLLQVHLRYHLLPETLWIAVNLVDRFLTRRVVSLVKLQLVGVTAMFIASKYEEIVAPSVDEFVYMTEGGYTREEILKGERIVLQTLDFQVSHYCSPYSWMRRISKADDYDIQTRTLSKFLTEVTLVDAAFVRVRPSMVAAVGMYTARRMLGGDWNSAFVFYSGFTEEQLLPGHGLLTDKLAEADFDSMYLYKKYASKKFLKASTYAVVWARKQKEDAAVAAMMQTE